MLKHPVGELHFFFLAWCEMTADPCNDQIVLLSCMFQSSDEENAAPNQDIHYGEVDFSKMNLSSRSPQTTTDQLCVVYSQITVGQSGNTRTGEDIYSMVKR